MFIKKIIQGIFIVIIPQLIGIQGDAEIIIEDVFYPTFSKEYLTEPDAYVDANNELFFNFSVIKEFPTETQAHFQLLGASMGEYVIQTGLDFQMILCDLLDEPLLLGPILGLFGFSENNCPARVGVYGSQGFSLPTEVLPDGFTPNKYLAILEFLYEEEKLLVVYVYCNIQ